MVSENWLPGWQATVRREGDEASAPAPVLRADLTFLGVPLDSGHSVVELSYRPASVRLGLLISGITLALLFGALVWLARARRRALGAQRCMKTYQLHSPPICAHCRGKSAVLRPVCRSG